MNKIFIVQTVVGSAISVAASFQPFLRRSLSI
jgi:hypothetical protein